MDSEAGASFSKKSTKGQVFNRFRESIENKQYDLKEELKQELKKQSMEFKDDPSAKTLHDALDSYKGEIQKMKESIKNLEENKIEPFKTPQLKLEEKRSSGQEDGHFLNMNLIKQDHDSFVQFKSVKDQSEYGNAEKSNY